MEVKRWLIISVLFIVPLHAQVTFVEHRDRISVEIDAKPYTDFFFPVLGNKPYILPLRTASGIIVTRPYPLDGIAGEETDHPYHHGLFFAHKSINGYTFWSTEPGSNYPDQGHVRLRKVIRLRNGRKSGTIKIAFDGLDPRGKPIMIDTETVTFYSDPVLRIIDFEIEVAPVGGPLTFGDTKEGTVGIRLASALSENRTGRMVNAQGQETEKNVWGKRSPWVDYYGRVDGKTVGVAIFDNPSNPRYPAYWMSRGYGLLAANIFAVRDFTGDNTKDGSMTIEPGDVLRLRYDVVIHPGDVHSANIAALFAKYIGHNRTQ
jgi:hypothetical protein